MIEADQTNGIRDSNQSSNFAGYTTDRPADDNHF